MENPVALVFVKWHKNVLRVSSVEQYLTVA